MTDYSIQEVAEVSGISVRSLRNYLRHYREFLHPRRGPCNALVFGDEDVQTFVKIRTLLREGKTRDEIQGLLLEGGEAVEMVIRRSDTPPPPAGMGMVVEQMELQNQLLERLVQENVALRERLDGMERRLARQVEAAPPPPLLPDPRRRMVRRRGTLAIRVPGFLLKMKDGAHALALGVAAAFFPREPESSERRG